MASIHVIALDYRNIDNCIWEWSMPTKTARARCTRISDGDGCGTGDTAISSMFAIRPMTILTPYLVRPYNLNTHPGCLYRLCVYMLAQNSNIRLCVCMMQYDNTHVRSILCSVGWCAHWLRLWYSVRVYYVLWSSVELYHQVWTMGENSIVRQFKVISSWNELHINTSHQQPPVTSVSRMPSDFTVAIPIVYYTAYIYQSLSVRRVHIIRFRLRCIHARHLFSKIVQCSITVLLCYISPSLCAV